MRRREFIAASVMLVWPHAGRAQQPTIAVIGYLSTGSAKGFAERVDAFRQGLSETGHIEGRNVVIDFRWTDGNDERLSELAADLVRRQVNVIATPGSISAALAAKAATTTIPIVFEFGPDPVALGVVTSMSRPGGNITGVTSLNVQVGPKRIELLRELVPQTTTLGLLVNPKNRNAKDVSTDAQSAARRLGVALDVLEASSEAELDSAFANFIRKRVGGLVVGPDPFFSPGAIGLRT